MGSTKAVIFDLDGVLSDSEPLVLEICVEIFHQLKIPVKPEDFHGYEGTGDLYITGPAEKHGAQVDLRVFKKELYTRFTELAPTRLQRFNGGRRLVNACRATGTRLGLASSADWIKIEASLNAIELPSSIWDAVVSGEDVRANKPAPDIFLKAAAALEVDPEECIVIEDAIAGIRSAKDAGMRCVAVAQTYTREELSEADLIRDRLDQVTLEDLGLSETPSAANTAS